MERRIDVSHSVTVSSLSNLVKWLSANDKYLLKKEFEAIGEEKQFTEHEAHHSYNRAKNRYNCVTYDHSRVKLQFTGEDGSDYINASWIGGEEGRENAYIAAQAPLQSTVSDMWRMVWEYRIEVILMITALIEDGNEKCVHYWPGDVGGFMRVDRSKLGAELKVTLRAHEIHNNWQHRIITVEEIEESLKPALTVHHYHFTDWPDRGVPSSPATLVCLLHHIHTAHPIPHPQLQTSHPPLLVHCSAGVGRTGTLLALDRLLEQLEAGKESVNVLQTVRDLRMSRPGMVQNMEQYRFIYSCLAHVKSRGRTEGCNHSEDITSASKKPTTSTNSEASSEEFPITPLEH